MYTFLLLEGYLVWDMKWLTPLLAVAVIYILAIKVAAHEKVCSLKPFLFLSSLIVIFFMYGSPLYSLSHLTFSFHMIHMSVLFFIIPPLILLGIPSRIYQTRTIRKMQSFFSMPALISFSIMFLVYHVPFMLNVISKNDSFYTLYFLTMVGLSFFMWMPIAYTHHYNQANEKQKRDKFAFISGVAITPACLVFIGYAVLGVTSSPLMSNLMTSLCIPAGTGLDAILPFPYHPQIDQLLAGVLMLAIHKSSIAMTLRIGNSLERN